MNVRLETKKPENNFKRKILNIVILAFCLIAILLAAYIQVFENKELTENPSNPTENVEISEDQYLELEEDFENIFTNQVNNLLGQDILITNKINEEDDIIAVSYETEVKVAGKYNLKVKIPYININTATVKKYNSQIEEIFKQKALDIVSDVASQDIVYTVDYVCYINKNNVLSIAIRSILKEGTNAQRTIIQTYNYDFMRNKEVTLASILEKKGLNEKEVESKVKNKIKQEQAKVEELQKLGYNIFERNPESNMYKLENTTEFFTGQDGFLYLIYAYGNENYTSELDVVIF